MDGSETGRRGGIYGRTKAVRDALVALIPAAANCSEVTAVQLESLTGTLSLRGRNIATLKPGDFADLVEVQQLQLSDNGLVTLPAGVFFGLTTLEALYLEANRLTELPLGVFGGLGALEILHLYSNSLTELPEGIFSDLTALQQLGLSDNRLAALPASVFNDLTALGYLWLSGNELTTLPVGVFDGLAELQQLWLLNNRLTALPVDVFDDLTALKELWLPNNRLTALPVGVFDSLTALQELWLPNNRLAMLSVGVFDGLRELEDLFLYNNGLTELPTGVFSEFRALRSLFLENNPGSADFLPVANAGADQTAEAGQTVTLRATTSGTDPWGDNVTYAWVQSDNSGNIVDLTGAGSARASFVMPADATELEFKFTVTGRGGGLNIGTDRVMVRFAVPDTVMTLSDPVHGLLPADATDIVGDELRLVYDCSADDLRGRPLAGGMEVTAAVDGAAITPAIVVDESSGRGEITVVLRREIYPEPDERELVVALSAVADGFAPGAPGSITTTFSFLPLSPGGSESTPTKSDSVGSIGNGAVGGMDAATILLAVLLFFASLFWGPIGGGAAKADWRAVTKRGRHRQPTWHGGPPGSLRARAGVGILQGGDVLGHRQGQSKKSYKNRQACVCRNLLKIYLFAI